MKSKKIVILLAFFMLIGCGPTPSNLRSSETDSNINEKQTQNEYIVTLNNDSKVQDILAEYNIEPKHVYRKVFNGFSARISDIAKAKLMDDARVGLIEADLPIYANETQLNPTWGLDRLDQRQLPLSNSYSSSYDGSSAVVYVVDTGNRLDHNEFNGRAQFGFDAFGGNGVDCNGHGTHVAGTIGGQTYGVAKNVNLVSVRVLDCNGSGSTSGVIAGLDWIAQNHLPKSVANMSLGGGASFSLDLAVQRLIFSGVTTVVAAGNENKDACLTSPARVSDAITVGATSQNDARASFSNFGLCLDMFAPGVAITSAWHTSLEATNSISGTSMAAPHVAGGAALLLDEKGSLSPHVVRDQLLSFSTKGIITSASSKNNHLFFNSSVVDGTGDYSSPTISLNTPSNNTTLPRRSVVSLTATASDNLGIQKVEYYQNGVRICTATAAPYSCSYKAANTKGLYYIQAKSFDAAGNIGSSEVAKIQVY